MSESPVKARPVTGCATKIKNIIGAPSAVQLCATPLKNKSSCTLLYWPGAGLAHRAVTNTFKPRETFRYTVLHRAILRSEGTHLELTLVINTEISDENYF